MTDYFIERLCNYCEIGLHSFHNPIAEDLKRIELDSLHVEGENSSQLLSISFFGKVYDLIDSKAYRIVN